MTRNRQSNASLSARGLRVATRTNLRPRPARGTPTIVRWPSEFLPATPERITLARAVADVRMALEEVIVATAEAAARAGSVTEALAALGMHDRGPLSLKSQGAPRADAPLSPREREVLALVAAGRTNKAIAEALYLSPNTVKTHVSSLLNKLHADSRVELAAIATRYGLS